MSDASPILAAVSRTWAGALARLRGGPPPLAMYAFGKHPAFADFLDVARLPPVPAAFRRFHDVLRPAVERDGGPTEPVLIAWRERSDAAVLWVQPSGDRGDAAGHTRRCPLLLGVAGRVDLATLLEFAGGRLAALAEQVMGADGDAALAAIRTAAAAWDSGTAGDLDGVAASALAATRAATGGPIVVFATATEAASHSGPLSALTITTIGERLPVVTQKT